VLRSFINTTPDVFVGLFTTTSSQGPGSLNIRASSVLHGGEANALLSMGRGANWHMAALLGFRFIEMDETLQIDSLLRNPSQITTFEPALGLPTGKIPVVDALLGTLDRSDYFRTHNSFYGGQLGVRGSYSWGRLSLSGDLKVGLGDIYETVDIFGITTTSGTTTITPTKSERLAGIPLTVATGAPNVVTIGTNSTNGGLFAQPTNNGHYVHNCFAVAPEGLLKLNYQFTDSISVSLGYSFLFLSSVARPGDQINTTINPSQLATPPSVTAPLQPSFQFRTTDYWVQGINFGIAFSF
jgi:hypothetical protein